MAAISCGLYDANHAKYRPDAVRNVSVAVNKEHDIVHLGVARRPELEVADEAGSDCWPQDCYQKVNCVMLRIDVAAGRFAIFEKEDT